MEPIDRLRGHMELSRSKQRSGRPVTLPKRLVRSCAVRTSAVVGLCALTVCGAAQSVPDATAATLPPSLVTIEQKMSGLEITSLRFSLTTSVSVPPGEHEALHLLKLLGLDEQMSGEVTTAPAAANVSLDFFGQPLTLRVVGKTVYAYFAKLGRADHGRPWIQFGRGGVAELFKVKGQRVRSKGKTTEALAKEPKIAEPPFAELAKLFAGAREVSELGPATVDGQPVTRFIAVLEPTQLDSGTSASTARVPIPTSSTGTLEVAFASDGVPVQIIIARHSSTETASITVEIPAVNFPLTIEAPPAAQTISMRQIRKLEKHHRKRKRA